MRTLAVVPARAGSKSIPHKNTRDFCGTTLVDLAVLCGYRTADQVLVTSNDPVVLRLPALKLAVLRERPDELCLDTTPMLDVLQDAVWCMPGYDAVVLLQPTSPLRKDEHVIRAIEMLEERPDLDSVASVVAVPPHMTPDYSCRIEDGLLVTPPAARRQDCRPAYYRDGTVYAIRTELLARGSMYGHCAPLLIPAGESVTIDTEADWAEAERLWRLRHA